MYLIKLLILICCISLAACSDKSSNKNVNPSTTSEVELANPDNLKFTYQIDSSYASMDGKIVDVSCRLYNGNSDSLFFFTYTCYDWEQNFIVDTNHVLTWNMINCVVSNPYIEKVAPNDSFNFNGHFFVKGMDPNDLELQYFIYQVAPWFDIHDQEQITNLKKTIIPNTEKIN